MGIAVPSQLLEGNNQIRHHENYRSCCFDCHCLCRGPALGSLGLVRTWISTGVRSPHRRRTHPEPNFWSHHPRLYPSPEDRGREEHRSRSSAFGQARSGGRGLLRIRGLWSHHRPSWTQPFRIHWSSIRSSRHWKARSRGWPYYGYGTGYGLGYGTINVNGLLLGNPLIANPITGTVTPDYTPAQKKIVAERYGKREATSEADSYYGYSGLGYGYGAGYGYGNGYGYGKRSADAEAGVASLYGPGYAPIATGAWYSWNYGVWPAGYGKRSADSEADAYYGYGAGLGYGAYSNGLGRHYGGAYSYGKRSADSEAYYGGLGYAGYGGIGYGYGGAYTGAYLG